MIEILSPNCVDIPKDSPHMQQELCVDPPLCCATARIAWTPIGCSKKVEFCRKSTQSSQNPPFLSRVILPIQNQNPTIKPKDNNSHYFPPFHFSLSCACHGSSFRSAGTKRDQRSGMEPLELGTGSVLWWIFTPITSKCSKLNPPTTISCALNNSVVLAYAIPLICLLHRAGSSFHLATSHTNILSPSNPSHKHQELRVVV